MAKNEVFYRKFVNLFYPERMMILGIIIILIALVQTLLYGYTTVVNPNLKLLEEPMDKTSFGIMLILVGLASYIFWWKYKIGRRKLGLFAFFFTLSIRTFWEINWATGAYMSSLYAYWSLTNKISPIYPGQAWPALDYLGSTPFYMNFILPVFAFATAISAFLLISLLYEFLRQK